MKQASDADVEEFYKSLHNSAMGRLDGLNWRDFESHVHPQM